MLQAPRARQDPDSAGGVRAPAEVGAVLKFPYTPYPYLLTLFTLSLLLSPSLLLLKNPPTLLKGKVANLHGLRAPPR